MRIEPFTLRGQHVVLEPLAPHHAEALQAAADQDRSTYGYTLVPSYLKAMHSYIDWLLEDAKRDTIVPFAQVRTSDHAPVGCTRFLNVTWYPGRDTPAEVEVGGTWLAADAQRSPINTEAKLLLLTHAFETWNVFRVAICTDAANQRSHDAIERLGATFEGILRRHRPNSGDSTTHGVARDSAMFSIVDREWPVVRDGLRRRIS